MFFIFVSLLFCLFGCASTSWNARVYHKGSLHFQIGTLPNSWQRVDVEGSLVAFHHHDGGSIYVYARCGRDSDDVPLSALTQHLLIGFTERNVQSEQKIPFNGREALRSVIDAKLDGVAVMLDIVVSKKDGCVYDLTHIAKAQRFEQNQRDFQNFIHEFLIF